MNGTSEAKGTGSRKLRGVKSGLVTSAAGDKTIRVVVDTLVKHRQYGKYVRQRSKFAVHDEKNTAQVGDLVEIGPFRPVSKTKRWRLLRVVREATIATRAAVARG